MKKRKDTFFLFSKIQAEGAVPCLQHLFLVAERTTGNCDGFLSFFLEVASVPSICQSKSCGQTQGGDGVVMLEVMEMVVEWQCLVL